MDASAPQKLYKYRKFDLYSLKMLTNGTVYFSDPMNFNDPLDCKPEILVDVDQDSLEGLCMRMTDRSSQILHECNLAVGYHHGDATEKEAYLTYLLGNRVKEELHSELRKNGVLSLAESWSCPLMWSHYGDQHNGICLGYETTRSSYDLMKKVDYDGTRCIKCSDLVNSYVNDCSTAKERIKDAFFFTKANDWKYEREWRLISDKPGEESSPFELTEIYFGMRCDHAVKATIVNLMSGFDIDYYEVFPRTDTFDLQARRLDTEAKQDLKARPPLRFVFGLADRHQFGYSPVSLSTELPSDEALP
ncbi:DUF2971 domain-containing protein [Geobacter sp. FeAm09]|uniref:DUF2971 domain-containing protein n=1 Tax=Geobacter sp. FeAm09 TaxID=2597769 RepID=UPI0011F09213|nr:DUF2971 domain-containing protein [Geobacter sp. FeAm09]QEM69493.1 DUF2971 domain-containing protein [Geobacter sp. FeAm09]